jgi:hypothetical protein
MILKHRCLLTCGLAILSVAVLLGTAGAQSSTRSSATKHHHAKQMRHPLYDYAPAAPVVPVERHRHFRSMGCYLPSDGCPSEYSVQTPRANLLYLGVFWALTFASHRAANSRA